MGKMDRARKKEERERKRKQWIWKNQRKTATKTENQRDRESQRGHQGPEIVGMQCSEGSRLAELSPVWGRLSFGVAFSCRYRLGRDEKGRRKGGRCREEFGPR